MYNPLWKECIYLIILAATIVLLLSYFIKKGYENTKNMNIKTIQVNDQYANDQTTFLKILHLSDLHLENISISPSDLYEKLKEDSYDLIAITGDLLDRKWTIPKLIPYLEMLNKLQAKYGIYVVLGNHDYFLRDKNLQTLVHTLEKNNCKVLINANERIIVNGKIVNIIGIDDFSTKRSNLQLSFKGVHDGINLVLTHDPNIVLHMDEYHFDYLLSGHFHGGQICYPKAYHLIKMGKLARMNVIKGLHVHGGKPFYISEGLGQTGFNIRVGSRPEITIHHLPLTSIKNNEWHAAM